MIKTEDTSLPRLDNKLKNNTILTCFPRGSNQNPLAEVMPSWVAVKIRYFGLAAGSPQMIQKFME
jgi:hypothetical protein